MNKNIIYLCVFYYMILPSYGFLFFNKKNPNNENSFEKRQSFSEEPKQEIKYNNLYLMSKRYEDFLSENYGIERENINHDIMTDFDIAINPSNIDAEYVNIYNRAMNSFNKYTSKEDCFQNSIKTLKYGCLEMELDDNKKMEYAVELTLCELTSANISIPTECQNNQKIKNMAKCVETISRYNQLWTSYSGYFKDVENAERLFQSINNSKQEWNDFSGRFTFKLENIIQLVKDYETIWNNNITNISKVNYLI
ncbi:hypothetical protein PIROE2DRAFT_57804 [Piromyces sp. E2]|nr:hypothetical protein PIROE2DRAFT_57804 [Piromyces sp. E2]|eukprot:OUM68832.1 hypothetical protein PIROE2DRAFT_57804 [Piromyces sp. E2]